MNLTKTLISAQTIVLAASIFIGSNSFVLAAAPLNDASDNQQAKPKAGATNGERTASTANTVSTTASPNATNTLSTAISPSTLSTNATSTNVSSGQSTNAVPGQSTNVSSGQSTSAVSGQSTNASPAQSTKTAGSASSNDASPSSASGNSTKWHPGKELSIGTDTQDLVPTDDPALARKQADAYPDSAEAHFILAVALTRTSRVEEALGEVRTARKLADQKGGATYFDKMISTYEDLLKNYPKENRVRYGLAWAYYMKAYLLASQSRKVAKWKAANPDPAKALAAAANGSTTNSAQPNSSSQSITNIKNIDVAKAAIASATKSGKPLDLGALLGQVGALAQGNASAIPKIPEFMDGVEAQDIPQIRKYFEQALTKMNELIAQKPDDVWALVYRAHLRAEYTGNIDEAMLTWKTCSDKFPNNPAAYFFLGEGYLKKGDLKRSISNVSKAVQLRGIGM